MLKNIAPNVSSFELIEASIADLDAHKDEWATLPIPEKISLLTETISNMQLHVQEWIDVSIVGKNLDPDSPWVGEEWISGAWALIGWINAMIETLEALHQGKNPPVKNIRTRANGQVVADVFPNNFYDKILLSGATAEVWMKPEITLDNIWKETAVFYQNPNPSGKVALVLGAGNVSSISPLDTLYKLYADGEVVILKMNPVNDYLGPVLEKILAPFVQRGFLRFAYGGAEIGKYLTDHEKVETLHITGSARTHDAIMFGTGEEGAARKASGTLRLSKPMTSELGGVGPVIVVPGPWTDADVKFQAENIATMKLHNAGCNCIAAQVVITSAGWEHRDALIGHIEKTFQALPPRKTYYPGANDREKRSLGHGGKEHIIKGRYFITNLDPNGADKYCFQEEFFSQALAQTDLQSKDPLTFLQEAISFANNSLDGTLGATILIHPKTLGDLGSKFEDAIAELRYGAIGINAWNAAAFLLPQAAWGAFPGHTIDDIQSGIGVVHNAFLFNQPERTVIRGPFRPMPRAWLHGELHLMPYPVWFVTNKTAATTAKYTVELSMAPSLIKLLPVVLSAMHG